MLNGTMGAQQTPSRIDKLEAARRQLDCAIRLTFADEDSLSIHTLALAAFKVLFDVYPHMRSDGFEKRLDELIQRLGWREFQRVPNFLKHADRDPYATLFDHSPEQPAPMIGMAAILYHRLANEMTPDMRAFDAWMHILNPDTFDLPPDEDPEFDAVFRESVRLINAGERSVRLLLGTTLRHFFAAHPEVRAFGAPREPGWTD